MSIAHSFRTKTRTMNTVSQGVVQFQEGTLNIGSLNSPCLPKMAKPHICLMLASPTFLSLCLVCTHGMLVMDMLAHSPPLPLVIDYLYFDDTTADGDITFALEQRDCMRYSHPVTYSDHRGISNSGIPNYGVIDQDSSSVLIIPASQASTPRRARRRRVMVLVLVAR